MTGNEKFLREFSQQMLRSMVQSVFVSVFNGRRKKNKLTQSELAKKMGVNRSIISRDLAVPPNWTVDKISDMAEALNVDIEIIARDRETGECHTARGVIKISVNTVVNRITTVDGPSVIEGPRIMVISGSRNTQGSSVRVIA